MTSKFTNGAETITVYLGTVLPELPLVFLLKNNTEQNLWNLFQGKGSKQSFDFIKVVTDPAQADFFMLPHNYFALKKIDPGLVTLAERHNKKILIFAFADSDETITIPHSIIFRYSQYGYKKQANEIITPFYSSPSYADNFLPQREEIWREIKLRDKAEKPTISFCGWADFPNWYRRLTYSVRVLGAIVRERLLGDNHAKLHLHGIYWRRRALRLLARSQLIKTNFIIRQSYSAQKDTVGAEQEYVESMLNSDFVLAPKGHANGSVRFYEALSLGRLPVLINTDCVLPLRDKINYSDFVVSVDYNDLNRLEEKILEFYNSVNNEEFKERQKMARAAFELLKPDSFFHITLAELRTRG